MEKKTWDLTPEDIKNLTGHDFRHWSQRIMQRLYMVNREIYEVIANKICTAAITKQVVAIKAALIEAVSVIKTHMQFEVVQN